MNVWADQVPGLEGRKVGTDRGLDQFKSARGPGRAGGSGAEGSGKGRHTVFACDHRGISFFFSEETRSSGLLNLREGDLINKQTTPRQDRRVKAGGTMVRGTERRSTTLNPGPDSIPSSSPAVSARV